MSNKPGGDNLGDIWEIVNNFGQILGRLCEFGRRKLLIEQLFELLNMRCHCLHLLGCDRRKSKDALAAISRRFHLGQQALFDVSRDRFAEGCRRQTKPAGDFSLRRLFACRHDRSQQLERALAHAFGLEARFQKAGLDFVKGSNKRAQRGRHRLRIPCPAVDFLPNKFSPSIG